MKRFSGHLMAIGIFCALTSACSASVLTIDNFESYTNNQAIATGAATTPWLRFGGVADNLTATTTNPLDGLLSAKIPISVTTTTSATIRYNNFGTATDLSLYKSASILTKSLAATPNTQIQLSITDATSSYTSNALVLETATGQTATFAMDQPTAFTRASGTDSFATVMSSVTAMGFRIVGLSTTASNETLEFDDFTLSTVPEPASAGLGLMGLLGVAIRRPTRRRFVETT